MDDIGPMPSTLYLYVDDCDARYQDALNAGATSLIEPGNYLDGDRCAGVKEINAII